MKTQRSIFPNFNTPCTAPVGRFLMLECLIFCGVAVLLLLICLPQMAVAQETNRASDDHRESLARASRLMKRIDKDGDGQFDKSEGAGVWRRLGKLDANNDEVLSIEELRQQPVAYLKAAGGRNLEVVYKQIDGRDLKLDLYYPAQQTKKPVTAHPLVIYTHGGGWAAGNKHGIAKNSFNVVFQKLLEHGFAVASVDYRLCRKGSGVRMRDCVIDSKDAVRYLASNRGKLKLNPQRFFVMGDSAGGQIAQMLLLTSPETLPGDEALASASYNMVAGVSWYGPCDFEKTDLFNHDDRADFQDRFGARIVGGESNAANKRELYREMSPINYLSADSPPLLMIQGDQDTTIPVKHARYMKQQAEVAKAPVETLIIKNAGHNWRKVDAPIEPSREVIVERTVEFFVEHYKK